MAFSIFDGTAVQARDVKALQQALITVSAKANLMNKQLTNMTNDNDVVAQFGVPLAGVAVFKTQVSDLVTLTEGATIQNFLGKLGFTTS